MKKLVKVLSVFVKLGERAASLFGKVVDAADRLLHYKEYRRQKRVAAVFRTMLCVACGVLAVVFFPYRVRVEIRSLMLRIYRKTTPYQDPQENSEEFDITGVEDEDAAECQVVGTAEKE